AFVAGHQCCRFPRIAILAKLPEFGKIGVPRWTRALRAIKDLSVGREFQNFNIAQAIRSSALSHNLSSRVKAFRAALPMVSYNALQIPFGGFARKFLSQRFHLISRQQRRFLAGDRDRKSDEHEQQSNGLSHGVHRESYSTARTALISN